MKTKLIGYLSLGYPSIEESIKNANLYAKSGCDIIEVGYPTDNPYIDGEYIGNTMIKGLENCPDEERLFSSMEEIKKSNPNIQILLVVYEHSIIKVGIKSFIAHCKKIDIQDLILVGPQNDDVKNELIKNNLKVSCYVTYGLPEKEIMEAKNSNGFVYLQAKPENEIREGCETLKQCIEYLKQKDIKNPIYVGVGISTPEDVHMASLAGADGVFVGSALIKKQHDEKELERFIIELKNSI